MNNKKELIMLWTNEKYISKPTEVENNMKVFDQIANYFSAGSYFYHIHNFSQNKMEYVHPNVKTLLGIAPENYSMEKILTVIHPEDIVHLRQKEQCAFHFLFNYLKPEQVKYYKVSYTLRIRKKEGRYALFLAQISPLNISDDGRLISVIVVLTDISHLGKHSNNRISFIDLTGNDSYLNLDPNDLNFSLEKSSDADVLTYRELDVVRNLSFGLDTKSIADALCISVNTVRTHRQNILRKANQKNMSEVIATYIRNGII